MFDVKEKLPENDLPVTIEDDVWVGAGAIVMKGITIGRGSIAATGAW
jgi:acetyltransferase-like isoleucine patch superfamily enzyme